VRAILEGTTVSDDLGVNDSGMLLDFGHIKNLLMLHVHDEFDHAFIYQTGDPVGSEMYEVCANIVGIQDPRVFEVPFIPTAENLAKHFFEVLYPKFSAVYDNQLQLSEIVVWETPTSVAYYGVEDHLLSMED